MHADASYKHIPYLFEIVAVAIINFSLAGVRLLIEGGSYSWMAFINFGAIPLGAIHKNNNAIGGFSGLLFSRGRLQFGVRLLFE